MRYYYKIKNPDYLIAAHFREDPFPVFNKYNLWLDRNTVITYDNNKEFVDRICLNDNPYMSKKMKHYYATEDEKRLFRLYEKLNKI